MGFDLILHIEVVLCTSLMTSGKEFFHQTEGFRIGGEVHVGTHMRFLFISLGSLGSLCTFLQFDRLYRFGVHLVFLLLSDDLCRSLVGHVFALDLQIAQFEIDPVFLKSLYQIADRLLCGGQVLQAFPKHIVDLPHDIGQRYRAVQNGPQKERRANEFHRIARIGFQYERNSGIGHPAARMG